jgi:hypothetical protein
MSKVNPLEILNRCVNTSSAVAHEFWESRVLRAHAEDVVAVRDGVAELLSAVDDFIVCHLQDAIDPISSTNEAARLIKAIAKFELTP